MGKTATKSRPRSSRREDRRDPYRYDLWRICGRDRKTRATRPVGYLVTTAERSPMPLAMVEGDSPESLAIALAIRRDPKRRGKLGRIHARVSDLRRASRNIFPVALLGMLLLPLDKRGRWIHGHFPGAMYNRTFDYPAGVGFMSYTECGLRPLMQPDSVGLVNEAPIAPSRKVKPGRLLTLREAVAKFTESELLPSAAWKTVATGSELRRPRRSAA